jgi:hypothetical protein
MWLRRWLNRAHDIATIDGFVAYVTAADEAGTR